MLTRVTRNAANAAMRCTRQTLVVRPTSYLNATVRSSSIKTSSLSRCFSTSSSRLGEGLSDKDLSFRIAEEIKYEESEGTHTGPNPPSFVREFLEAHEFKIHDQQGHDEVVLSKNFGNENIRVLFSISDINQASDEGVEGLEDAFENDEVVSSINAAKNKDAESAATTAASSESDESQPASFPVRCSITISKPSGCLSIDTIAQDGVFVIDNIAFYKDSKLATDLTSEADWQRRGLYIGPQFDDMDENVQEAFEQYLEERGINTTLALFVIDYIDYKEQREYVSWLHSVKDFIET